MESHVKITLDPITVMVRIGLYEDEKNAAQRIVVEADLFAAPEYLKQSAGEKLIDYGRIYEFVQGWTLRDHVELIETYIQDLIEACFEFEAVEACRVKITKADIFAASQGAGVEVFIKRTDWGG